MIVVQRCALHAIRYKGGASEAQTSLICGLNPFPRTMNDHAFVSAADIFITLVLTVVQSTHTQRQAARCNVTGSEI